MALPGVEMLVGVAGDERFGPVVACAAGGTAVQLLGHVQVRLAPVADLEAEQMVRGLRAFALLDGYRGVAPCDIGALQDVIVRVAALAAAHPEIAELDLNPVVVSASGALIVDARVSFFVSIHERTRELGIRVKRPVRRPSAQRPVGRRLR